MDKMKKLTKKQIKELILLIVNEVDYDIYKSLDPEYAEEPEYAKEEMKRIIKTVEEHFKKLQKND